MTAPFDGTTTYLVRNSALLNVADSKKGTFSCWVNVDSTTAGYLLAGDTSSDTRFRVRFTGGVFQVLGENSSSTQILDLRIASGTLTTGTWYHIASSWDLSTGATHLLANRSDVKIEVTATDDTIDYTVERWAIGAELGTANLDGRLHDLLFWPGEYVDLSDDANLRYFVSMDERSGISPGTSSLYCGTYIPSGPKPVGYGHDGSFPLNAKPAVFFSGGWKKNRGTGGPFTLQGSWEDIMNEGDTTGKGARATGQPENPNAYRLASRPGEMAPERWFDSEKSGMSAKRSETFIEKRAGHPDIGKRLRQKDEDDAETRDLTSLRQQWSSLIRPNEEDSLERLPGE